MSFKTAIKFLTEYRNDRAMALNNEQVLAWSTARSATVSDLVKVFDWSAEDATWNKAYNTLTSGQSVQSDKMQATRLAINFLAGCSRDVRSQYGAGAETRARLSSDFDRYEYGRLAYVNKNMDSRDQTMDARMKAT